MLGRSLQKFKEFDKVSEFRLINAFLVAIGLALLSPILVTLKGMYLAVWVISVFSIISTLAVKTNRYMTKTFSIEQLFRMGIGVHLLLITVAVLYFYSPALMIWLESMLVIIEVAVFSSYSILLNNYIADYYPKSMQEFQVVRNSSWADGFLVGLFLVTGTTYFFSTGAGIIVFVGFNICFSLWMIYNWNFYEDIENLKEDKEV
jgi:hypothetical protein